MPISREQWAVLLVENRERILSRVSARGIRNPSSGCLMWPGATVGEYAVISIKTPLGWRAIRVSRFLLAVSGKLDISDEEEFACHHCDTPRCVEVLHMFPGSQEQNMQDASNKSRIKVPGLTGEDHPACKLTLDQVREIRTSNLPQRELAAKYGVSKYAVWSIHNGLTWKVSV